MTKRERRRTAKGRRQHRRRHATRGLVAFAILLFAAGMWLGIDAVAARNSMNAARSSLLDAQEALGEGDVTRAQTRIETAATAAASAKSSTDGPHWAAVRQLPLVGDDARTVRHVIEVVDAATTAAVEVAALADEFTTSEGDLPQLTVDGRLELTSFRAFTHGLSELDLAPLRSARGQLVGSSDQPRIPAVAEARVEALEAADGALSLFERGRDSTGAVIALLGAEEPRRYLVAVQNSAELRGTGGLIGFLAVLDVRDGELQLSDPEGVDPQSVVDGGDLVVRSRFHERDLLDDPVDRPDDFAARYDSIAAGAFLASTNADPDLPTVAPVVLDIYEERTGQRLDGVIAIDPLGLQRIQQASGPLELPEPVHALAPELPHPIPPQELASLLLVDVYDALGGPSDERRLYQSTVAEAALSSLLEGSWNVPAVGIAVGEAVAGRHLQVYSRDEDTQEAILRLRAGGELSPLQRGDDFLAVSAVNAAAGKGDVHVAHRSVATIELDEPRILDGEVFLEREITNQFEVRNAIDVDAHDDYIVTSLRTQRIGESMERDPRRGLSRTWLTQWLPADADLRSVTDNDGQPVAFGTGELHGRLAVDHFLEVMPGDAGVFEVASSARVPVLWDGAETTYALSVWRQGKGIPDELDLSVVPPTGWEVLDVSFSGGGGPGLIGPGSPGTPIDVNVEDGVVRLRGSATADARLVVRLAPRDR